jgi:oxygen-independent coproporphyrinogen-3 oxidase
MDAFVDSILIEIDRQKDYLKDEEISTIYFGGGTPSVLSAEKLDLILSKLKSVFDISKDCEITLEANPEDIKSEFISQIKSLGVNRLSIGCQAFDNVLLKNLNRNHSVDDAVNALKTAKKNGFDNISADLIYGIPGLSTEDWEKSLNQLIELDIPHISAYNLTVEPKTALEVLIRKGKYPNLDENLGSEQFEILIPLLESNGYEHYEISNFAKDKLYSKHNTNYWKNKKYLGLGPSAHSYNQKSRSWNISNIKRYIEDLALGMEISQEELLSKNDMFNEYIMLSLRTIWGVDLKYLKSNFGDHYLEYFKKNIYDYQKKGFIEIEGNFYKLSRAAKLFADRVASDCFIL